MPIDSSIYNMVGKFPQVQVPDPLERQTRLAQLKQLASQGQMTDMAMADAQAKRAREARAKELLTKNQGDIQKAAQEAAAAGDYETASEFQTLIKSRAQTDAVYQKSVSEAQEAYLKASKEERAAVQAGLEDLAKGIQWVEQGAPEELPARYAKFVQAYPPQVREKYGIGPQYDPSIGGLIKARAQAWGDVSKSGGTPASAVGKIMEDYKRGFYGTGTEAIQLRDAAIRDATTKGPGVTVGLMAPQKGVDTETGQPVFFQPSKGGGKPSIVPGVAPEEKFSKIPSGTVNAFNENEGLIARINEAKSMLAKNPKTDAIGAWNILTPESVRQRTDPKGNEIRAIIAQIGSLKYKDLSGAAVTASEDKRMAPYIPKLTDTPEAAQTKLNGLLRELQNVQSGIATAYSNGYQPIPQFERYTKKGPGQKVALSEIQKAIAPGGKYAGKTVEQVKAALKSRGIEVE